MMPPGMQPMGQVLCREIHQVDTPAGSFGIEVSVRAWPALPLQQAAKSWPFPLRTDLSQRIAALIREDCGTPPGDAA